MIEKPNIARDGAPKKFKVADRGHGCHDDEVAGSTHDACPTSERAAQSHPGAQYVDDVPGVGKVHVHGISKTELHGDKFTPRGPLKNCGPVPTTPGTRSRNDDPLAG
jgi:hypothetical protein